MNGYYGFNQKPDFDKFKKWLESKKKEFFGKRGRSLTEEEMQEMWDTWNDWGRPSGGK